jgi:hypothetical protein
MAEIKYKIVAHDENMRDAILATLVRHPTESIAYLCLMSGQPMSTSEMISSLGLQDGWFTDKFNEAVKTLSDRGLIKRTDDEL